LTSLPWKFGLRQYQPKEATSLAAKILSEHLKLFIGLTDIHGNVEIMVEKKRKLRIRSWK
jgi:DNA-directed RNA polymerase alpha subunit